MNMIITKARRLFWKMIFVYFSCLDYGAVSCKNQLTRIGNNVHCMDNDFRGALRNKFAVANKADILKRLQSDCNNLASLLLSLCSYTLGLPRRSLLKCSCFSLFSLAAVVPGWLIMENSPFCLSWRHFSMPPQSVRAVKVWQFAMVL